MPAFFSILFVIGLGFSLTAQNWDAADRATKRLAPDVFGNLPVSVRKELRRRGCTVPQPFTAKDPENVISGHFTSGNQTDWAVLCSRRGISSLLVFRGGVSSNPPEIAAEADRASLQIVGRDGVIGYSRVIATATSGSIRDHYKAHGGPKPPLLDHDGISDVFIEKASVVWYWYRGRWLKLQGGD